MQPLTIALIDGFDDGHHLTTLRNYADALLKLGHRVAALLPEPARVDAWFTQHADPQGVKLTLHPFRHAQVRAPFWRLRKIWPPLAAWRHAARAIREMERRSGWKVDLVFFCWLDDYIVGLSPLCRFALPACFPYPWSGVFFHPWHLRSPAGDGETHYSVSTQILATRRCRSVAVLDEGIAGALERRVGKPVVVLPDATDESLPAIEPVRVRTLREKIGGRRVVGMVGELSRRKGVLSFLDAAEAARGRPWVFLLAGALGTGQLNTFFPGEQPRVKEALQGNFDNVIVLDQRIEDEGEFNAIITLCDVLFAAYETFGHSSGIVTKAAVFRKPILVSPGYCMAERVKRFRIGLAVDAHDHAVTLDALTTLLDSDALARRVGRPDFEGFHREHSLETLSTGLGRVVDLV